MEGSLFNRLLKRKLRLLARATIRRFQPLVIGVTGTVGKTSTKRAIAAVLAANSRVRADEVSLNTEFGFPLAVIGTYSEHDLRYVRTNSPAGNFLAKLFFWKRVLFGGFWRLWFLPRRRYPEVIVLEYGADQPGDIKYLTGMIAPQIAVITAVGEIPVHVGFYKSVEDVAMEKSQLGHAVPATGTVVLNCDDPKVAAMAEKLKARILTFGFSEKAEVRIENFETKIEEVSGIKQPVGINFKLRYNGSVVPVRLLGTLGRAQAYVAAAAACVGILRGLNLVQIAEALANYVPPSHRLNVIPGIGDILILDDSYNASLLAVQNALEALQSAPAKRRVAVLGDMRELGNYTKRAHEIAGMAAAGVCDLLITVGPSAAIISEAAKKAGQSEKQVLHFATVEEAIMPVKSLLKPGDLVLIKASLAIGLTKLVEELKA